MNYSCSGCYLLITTRVSYVMTCFIYMTLCIFLAIFFYRALDSPLFTMLLCILYFSVVATAITVKPAVIRSHEICCISSTNCSIIMKQVKYTRQGPEMKFFEMGAKRDS